MITCRKCLYWYNELFSAEAEFRARARQPLVGSQDGRRNFAAVKALRPHIEAVRVRLDEHLGRHGNA